MPMKNWNRRKCTIAVFILVTAFFLTGRYSDMYNFNFLSATWDHTDTEGRAISQTDTEDRAISQTDTKGRAISQTDKDGRAISQTDTEGRAISQTDTEGRAISQTDTEGRAISQTDTDGSAINLACPWNGSSPPLGDTTKKKYEIHDLFRVKIPDFLPNYKNPCWRKSSSTNLVCLPYFHLIGFPKCGTTFTFSTMIGHPEVAKGKWKEPHWISRHRFEDSSHLQSYLDIFSPAARRIESNVSTDSHAGKKFHPIITGDGSASTAWHNPNWRNLPGNYNCTEPRVLTPHYIHHLNPSTKIIIVVRNPTDRIISGYNYFTPGHITAESFHQKMVDELRTFEDCCSKYSLRTCAYNDNIRLPIGLYHVFISDWMKVFPEDQILLVRLEDMHEDPYTMFSKIFQFLGLRHLSRSDLQEILKKSKMNDKEKKFQAKNETRRLLGDFYRPHNIQLSKFKIPIYI
ncbi:carbohydrate sulfotransferase 15-like [Haliotis cracherodii]|uniref:carbohydrate sulfotransferase 15-like n=1 Tax=Haliotis cracherodii TaxID=6455 RepID=UPI0039EB1056